MKKIRKVVIPVAGFGTRFLPSTKAQPKEMLTVVDKPVIQYVVEEAVAAGITDVILVTGASKRAVEDHFDYNYELQTWLKKHGKHEVRREIKKIADMANFIYIRQKGPYGNGTPVLCAEQVVGDEPFAVLWGDEFFYGRKNRLSQLIKVYERYGDPVLTAYRVKPKDTTQYGMLDAVKTEDNIYQVKKIIEKPGPKKTPSLLAALGGYVLTPDIFETLRNTKLGKSRELWLPDAIHNLSKKRPLYACEVQDVQYYDIGSKLGYLKANVDFGLRNPALKKDFAKYLRSIKK